MKKTVVRDKVLWLVFIIISGTTFPALAGNGARHPLEGALTAKYLSFTNDKNENNNIARYSHSFLLGMYSHLLSDQLGNFEPRGNSKEMLWFSAEGLAGPLLLLPHWKKDPALFWGSIGAMFPDIEHSLQPFGKRIFPTHSGYLTHGELVYFWHGVISNLCIDGLALYAINHGIPRREDGSPLLKFGWTLSNWDIPGTTNQNGAGYKDLNNKSLIRNINLAMDLHKNFAMQTSWGVWMKEASTITDRDTPEKIVIQSHLLGITLHTHHGKLLDPFITAGTGVYIASKSEPVNRNGIAFARYQDSNIGFHYGAGIRIPVNNNSCIIINHCYHNISFSKKIDGNREYSGWAGGLTLERNL